MDKLMKILMIIKEKPNIYLGKPSLERLYAFISGYIECLRQIESYENYNFYPGFNEYVKKKFEIDTTKNWSSIIVFFSSSEEEAFYKFYDLFKDFLVEQVKLRK